jgi:hypothetical protein
VRRQLAAFRGLAQKEYKTLRLPHIILIARAPDNPAKMPVQRR